MAFDPLSPVEPAAGHLPVAVGAADTANHAARNTGAKKAKGRGTGIQADHISQARTRPLLEANLAAGLTEKVLPALTAFDVKLSQRMQQGGTQQHTDGHHTPCRETLDAHRR